MLTGALVRLRAIEPSDLPLLAKWRSDPALYPSFYEFEPIPLAGQEEWYRKHCFNDREKNFIIEETVTGQGQAIGMIALVSINWRSRNAEVGRLTIGDARFRGRGFAPEAIVLATEYAFDHLHLHKLYCEVLASQPRVISLHKKLGSVEEGTRAEHVFKGGAYENVVLLRLLREDYVRGRRFADLREVFAARAARYARRPDTGLPCTSC